MPIDKTTVLDHINELSIDLNSVLPPDLQAYIYHKKVFKVRVDLTSVPPAKLKELFFFLDELASENRFFEIIVGDVHGCFEKMLYIPTLHNIAEITEDSYQKIRNIIHKPTTNGINFLFNPKITRKDIEVLREEIAKIKFKKNPTRIIFVGDIIADRGACDYPTFLFIKKAIESKVDIRVLLSNHDIEFIFAIEKNKKFNDASFKKPEYAHSMYKMQKLIDAGIITREEVLEDSKAYLSTLTAIHYFVDESKTTITIASHAPIDLHITKAIAEHLKIKFKDTTITELTETIDEINKVVRKHVVSKTLHTVFNLDESGHFDRELSGPLNLLIWNQDPTILDRSLSHQGYSVFYIHGHIPQEPTEENVDTLDNYLGKAKGPWMRGIYTAVLNAYIQNTRIPKLEEALSNSTAANKPEANEKFNKALEFPATSANQALFHIVDKSEKDTTVREVSLLSHKSY